MLLIIVMQIKLNVAVVAEKNRVLLRVSFRSTGCTKGVIEALMVVFLRKKKKARDMCDEIKKKIQYWVNVMIYISDEIVQSNLDYPDFSIIRTFSQVPIWSGIFISHDQDP